MIDPTSSSPATTLKPLAAVKNPLDISSGDFLQLLIAQLQHQDPFAPQDPNASVAQFASLAQVTTLQEISGTLHQLLSGRSAGADVAGWIGHAALVPSASSARLPNGSYAGVVQNGSDEDVEISFSDAAGNLLHSTRLAGPVQPGQAFEWDGAGTPAGSLVTVKATSTSGPVATAIWTQVTGVVQPGDSSVEVETPVGRFPPAVVLELR